MILRVVASESGRVQTLNVIERVVGPEEYQRKEVEHIGRYDHRG